MKSFKYVDQSAIQHLVEHAGEAWRDLIDRLLDLYRTSTPEILVNMERNLNENKLSDLCRQAHSLKSSSLSLGAVSMAEISSSVEEDLMNKVDRSPEFFLEKIKSLNHLLPETLTELEELSQSIGKED